MTAFSLVTQTAIYEQLTKEIPVSYPGVVNEMPSPFDPSGWFGASDPDLNYKSVIEPNPSGQEAVGNFEYIGPSFANIATSVNFSVDIGDKLYLCIIVKCQNNINSGVRMRIQDGGTQLSNSYVNCNTGLSTSNVGVQTVKSTLISNGYVLIQVEYISTVSTINIDTYIQFYEVDQNGNGLVFPDVGDEINCQAVFFGKADDFPAQYYAGGELFDPNGLPIPVYDDVPQAISSGDSSNFPYLVIGEDVITDTSTDLELMADASIVIHSWSRYSGRLEIKEIQGLVYDALNRANLVQSGYKIININNVSTESQLDSDGFTRHGVQTFKLMIEEL